MAREQSREGVTGAGQRQAAPTGHCSGPPVYRACRAAPPRILHAPPCPTARAPCRDQPARAAPPASAQTRAAAFLAVRRLDRRAVPAARDVSAQECLAQPMVIFTRDIVMRADHHRPAVHPAAGGDGAHHRAPVSSSTSPRHCRRTSPARRHVARRQRRCRVRLRRSRRAARAAARRERDQLPGLPRFPLPAGPLPAASGRTPTSRP